MADSTTPLVLVTGASGFVATWLIKELLEKGEYRVRGTVRDKTKQDKVKPILDLVPMAKYPLELVEADLNDKACWGPAVEGCSYVFHVASPLPPTMDYVVVDEEAEFIRPAVNGVVNILTACSESGTVKRVVVTSSSVAVDGFLGNPGRPKNHQYTEEDWAVEESVPAGYVKSKLKSEQAAWAFMEKLEQGKGFEMVVVNPSLVQGPLLTASCGEGTSASYSVTLLKNKTALPNICEGVIDVRDVVAGEIAAMFTPSAAGKRIILDSYSLTMREFSEIVKKEFEPQGYTVPLSDGPDLVKQSYSHERMKDILGVIPRPVEQAIIDMGYSLIELGIVDKTPGYLGPPELRK